jgi:dipeptidyl-peptidase-4
MRRPEVNDYGYDNADLCRMADRLNGKLLIVHGLGDDNVHAQNTLLYIDALVKAGKQFEMQLYPDDNHFLRRRANYEHLHRRLMLFLNENL